MLIKRTLDDLTIQDDYMFKKVMENEAICTKMLERILHIKIGKITYREAEKSLDMKLESKGIRLDVYVQDEEGTVFDIEMQTTNYRSELKRRGRYYQSVMDLDLMKKGELYEQLNQTYIIFICTFDLFCFNRHIYTFSNRCLEVPGLELDDKATKIFLNSKGTADDVDDDLKAFLQYVNGVITEDPLVQEIHQEVHEIKQNEKWRDEYMFMADKIRFIQQEAIEEGMATGMQKGLATGMQKGLATGMQKGRADSQKEIIANMLRQRLDCAQISKLTGLSEKDVQAMAQELKVQ